MPVPPLNRRRFLGYSAAAGLAIGNGSVEALPESDGVRVGLIGAGNRGTALLRAALALPGVSVTAVCDADAHHRVRAQNIAEKASSRRPEGCDRPDRLLARSDVDAVLVALPCDLHASVNAAALEAGKHLYAEKPLALTVQECDHLIALARKQPRLVFHVGHQRRFNSRYQAVRDRLESGDLGRLVDCQVSWTSSQGPMMGKDGWLAERARSGDWMVEQAVHVWDLLCWLRGTAPSEVFGNGARDLYDGRNRHRDVTDYYVAHLKWPDGFQATLRHSWIDTHVSAVGGMSMQLIGTAGMIDLTAGTVVYRDKSRPRETLAPASGSDTTAALAAFLDEIQHHEPRLDTPRAGLDDARRATQVGLLVRRAVDESRLIAWSVMFGS